MRKNIAIINTPEGVYIGWDVKSIEEWDEAFKSGEVLVYNKSEIEFVLLNELWNQFKRDAL